MKSNVLVLVCSAASLASCSQPADNKTSTAAASNAATVEKKHAYCFFKDDEMKSWKASREANGNIRVEGKAHVKDPRYKAVMGQVAVGPKKVLIFPTISTNDTGYAQPDDWWNISVGVPNTASLNEAEVQCGNKTVADLQLPPRS